MSLSEGDFLRFLSMELYDFLEEYGRVLKEDLEKTRSLSAMASVYIQSASKLLRTENQREAPRNRGYVYLLSAVGIDLYKIGSSEDGIDNFSEYFQPISVLEFRESDAPSSDKRRIQSMFEANRVTEEWFNFSEAELNLVRQQFA
jgi:hypothetical protein